MFYCSQSLQQVRKPSAKRDSRVNDWINVPHSPGRCIRCPTCWDRWIRRSDRRETLTGRGGDPMLISCLDQLQHSNNYHILSAGLFPVCYTEHIQELRMIVELPFMFGFSASVQRDLLHRDSVAVVSQKCFYMHHSEPRVSYMCSLP